MEILRHFLGCHFLLRLRDVAELLHQLQRILVCLQDNIVSVDLEQDLRTGLQVQILADVHGDHDLALLPEFAPEIHAVALYDLLFILFPTSMYDFAMFLPVDFLAFLTVAASADTLIAGLAADTAALRLTMN